MPSTYLHCVKSRSPHFHWCYYPNNIWWKVKIMKFLLMKFPQASSFLQMPWFEILSSASWSRIFSKYVNSFDVSVTKYASDFNLWTLEVLGRVRTELCNTRCVSVCRSCVFNEVPGDEFCDKGSLTRRWRRGMQQMSHILPEGRHSMCNVTDFIFLLNDWICHVSDTLMMGTE